MYEWLIIGFLQGLLEWLPVSSSGQLFLVLTTLLKISVREAYIYTIYLHAGTCMVTLLKYRRDYHRIVREVFCLRFTYGIVRAFFIATTFSLITGFVVYNIALVFLGEMSLDIVMFFLGIALTITGFLTYFSKMNMGSRGILDISFWEAALLGFVQGLSVIPGLSRSGLTISVLLLLGFKPIDAFNLSFIISLPAIVAAIVYSLVTSGVVFDFRGVIALISCFISGYLGIELMLSIARKFDFSKVLILMGAIIICLTLPLFIP